MPFSEKLSALHEYASVLSEKMDFARKLHILTSSKFIGELFICFSMFLFRVILLQVLFLKIAAKWNLLFFATLKIALRKISLLRLGLEKIMMEPANKQQKWWPKCDLWSFAVLTQHMRYVF